MLGDARRAGHQIEQVVREIHGLDRAQAQPLDGRFVQQPPHQIGQPNPSAEIAPPAAQVDPAQHHLAILRRERAHLLHHALRRRAAAAAAHIRNDAERAPVIAAILDLEVGARAVARGVLDRRRQKIGLRENIADLDLPVIIRGGNEFRNARLVRIPHHQAHAFERGQFLRRTLRVAAGDQDARARLLAMDAPDHLPHFVIRGRGDGAGVQHHQVGILQIGGRGEALRRQPGFNRRAIRLRGPAPEILDQKTLHCAPV